MPSTVKYDIEEMTPSQLIQNIEWAFKVYQERPWNKNLSFENFCESILPYRIGDEPLDVSWREDLYYRFNPLIERIEHLPEIQDPLFVAKTILENLINVEDLNFTTLFPSGPHLGARVVDYSCGTCREFSDMVLYVMRALGIPCGIDFMILRGDNNVSHYWNYFLDKEEEVYYCETPDLEIKKGTCLLNPKGKVYRSSYHINKTIIKELHKYPTETHSTFYRPLFYDVTEHYSNKLSKTLSIPMDFINPNVSIRSNKIIYLCISKHTGWEPIDYTINNKNIVFRNVEGGVVYWLGIYKDQHLQIISIPFLLEKESGIVRMFNEGGDYEDVILFYKFPLFDEFFRESVIGGVFEGSSDNSFSTVDTLHNIKKIPERLLNTVFLESEMKFQYVRYFGPKDGYANMAEIAFYENVTDTIPLSGIPIGVLGNKLKNRFHEYENLFDGDPYTSFNYPEPYGGWGGLDLGRPKKISKIIYTPRNRDNFVRKGDLYECFFLERLSMDISRKDISN